MLSLARACLPALHLVSHFLTFISRAFITIFSLIFIFFRVSECVSAHVRSVRTDSCYLLLASSNYFCRLHLTSSTSPSIIHTSFSKQPTNIHHYNNNTTEFVIGLSLLLTQLFCTSLTDFVDLVCTKRNAVKILGTKKFRVWLHSADANCGHLGNN